MANPLIPQGTLNRILGTASVTSIPALNVTPSFLGKEGLSLAFDGEATTFITTMTGMVTSGEPYQGVTLTMHLLKTQGLAAQYKAQFENNTFLGDMTVTPDALTLPSYPLTNCALANIAALTINGTDAGYVVTIKGYYVVNNALWS